MAQKPRHDRKKKVIEALNKARSMELHAIHQYMNQHYNLDNMDYGELAGKVKLIAIDEMRHAEKLIGRILFLEGAPIVTDLKKVRIGASVDVQHKNDLASETDAVTAYNAGIRQAVEASDNGTRELLESILKDEEEHLDWLDAQIIQVEQMGLPTYLVEQIG